ncbi:MAG: hypothetical protein ACREDK_02970 [Thermoplasmata archaeon]
MAVLSAWSLTLLLAIAGIVALNQLGLNLAVLVSASLHLVEHFLGQPLVVA